MSVLRQGSRLLPCCFLSGPDPAPVELRDTQGRLAGGWPESLLPRLSRIREGPAGWRLRPGGRCPLVEGSQTRFSNPLTLAPLAHELIYNRWTFGG